DETYASGWPLRTSSPGAATTRVAGPETGESPCVDRSPLEATGPVACPTGRNDPGCTWTILILGGWSSVSTGVCGVLCRLASARVVAELEVQPAATNRVVIPSTARRRPRGASATRGDLLFWRIIGGLRWGRLRPGRGRGLRAPCSRQRGHRRVGSVRRAGCF